MLKSIIPQLDYHLKLWPQNSLPIAKPYMGLSKGFHSLKTKWCCLHALLQPRFRQWPSWEVAFANQMDRIWMCSWAMYMVHVRRNQGQKEREKGETLGRRPVLRALSRSGTELQARPCFPCHFGGMFVNLGDKLYLIHQFVSLTYKYLNIWYLGFYLYSSSSPENSGGKPTDEFLKLLFYYNVGVPWWLRG